MADEAKSSSSVPANNIADEAKSSSSVPPKDKPKKRFTLTRWDAIALTKWNDVAGTVCVDCREIMAKPCINCKEAGLVDCRIVHGVCGHMFHEHCILLWMKKTPFCPTFGLLGKPHKWEVSRYGL